MVKTTHERLPENNFNFGDIMTALLWLPYKGFMKELLDDEKRETILQSIDIVSYEDLKERVKEKDIELNPKRLELAKQAVRLFADDLERTKKFINIIELYEQGVQLCPPYTNEELLGFAPRYRDDVCKIKGGVSNGQGLYSTLPE